MPWGRNRKKIAAAHLQLRKVEETAPAVLQDVARCCRILHVMVCFGSTCIFTFVWLNAGQNATIKKLFFIRSFLSFWNSNSPSEQTAQRQIERPRPPVMVRQAAMAAVAWDPSCRVDLVFWNWFVLFFNAFYILFFTWRAILVAIKYHSNVFKWFRGWLMVVWWCLEIKTFFPIRTFNVSICGTFMMWPCWIMENTYLSSHEPRSADEQHV